MRKKIIGIILLVLIVFGGYKLFANVSANNVNSNSMRIFQHIMEIIHML